MAIFFTILISLAVGLFLGSYLLFRLIIAAFKNDPGVVIEELSKQCGFETKIKPTNDVKMFNAETDEVVSVPQELLDEAIELTVEQHSNQFYMFFKHNDAFVSQGKSILEALDRAHKRYPGNDFVYTLDDGE